MIVVDSSAFIALINRENGWEAMEPYADGMAMSAVNVSESVCALRDKAMPEDEIMAVINGMIADIVLFDSRYALLTANLRQETKRYGLSLGDRACIALGMERRLPIFTADKIWSQCGLDADIRVIR